MTKPLRASTDHPQGRDPTPLPPITGPFIRCQECSLRAYLVPDWRPSPGLHPFLRKFICERHHATYKAFTQSQLDTSPQPPLTAPGSEA